MGHFCTNLRLLWQLRIGSKVKSGSELRTKDVKFVAGVDWFTQMDDEIDSCETDSCEIDSCLMMYTPDGDFATNALVKTKGHALQQASWSSFWLLKSFQLQSRSESQRAFRCKPATGNCAKDGYQVAEWKISRRRLHLWPSDLAFEPPPPASPPLSLNEPVNGKATIFKWFALDFFPIA